MPRTTVYIRNEDWERWKALDSKSERISRMINGVESKETQKKERLCKEHGVPSSVCKLMKHGPNG